MKGIYKLFLLASCVAGVGVYTAVSDSDDTPAQALARKAMMEKFGSGAQNMSSQVDNDIARARSNAQSAAPTGSGYLHHTEPPQAAVDAYHRKVAELAGNAGNWSGSNGSSVDYGITSRWRAAHRDYSDGQSAKVREIQAKCEVAMYELKARLDAQGSSPQMAGMAVAPAPVALTAREQRLAELLGRYKADVITPHQYQEERATILAQTQG